MQPRIAFTAQFWGHAAVVCRAVEDSPGPIVDQQFGLFETWTQANTFAAKLNEGLDVDPLEAIQIVTSSLLSTASVLHAVAASDRSWDSSPVRLAAREANLRFVLAELALALTFCHSLYVHGGDPAPRMIRGAHNALRHARKFVVESDGCEIQEVTSAIQALDAALQALPPDANAVQQPSP